MQNTGHIPPPVTWEDVEELKKAFDSLRDIRDSDAKTKREFWMGYFRPKNEKSITQ